MNQVPSEQEPRLPLADVVSTQRRFWVAAAAVALAFQAAFLGGATALWSRGLTVALIGLAVLLYPPQRRLGRWRELLLLVVVAWSALALLPASWLGVSEPAWRAHLRDFAPDLPRAISPQPWLTAEGCTLSAVGILALYWFATLPWNAERRACAVRLAAGAGILFAACCLFFHATGWQPPFWHNDARFGPFPSRNHTGNLLAVSLILAVASAGADFARKRPRAWWFAAGAVVLGLALVQNLSRGGALAAVFGLAFYFVRVARQRRSWPAFGIGIAILIFLATCLLLFSGQLSKRIGAFVDTRPLEILGFRAVVYRDTVRMTGDSPLFGVGLGNFEAVFPMFRAASLAAVRLIHPESDWFWAAAELGWAGAALILAAIVLPGRGSTERLRPPRLRATDAIAPALCAFLLHSIFDVPAHLFGTLLPAALLLGLRFADSTLPRGTTRTRTAFRIVGFTVLAAGVWMFAGGLGHAWTPARAAATQLARAKQQNQATRYAEARAAAAAGLQAAPLSWQLRFEFAKAQLGLGDIDAAQASFKCARLLQPFRADLAEAEANLWAPRVPALAAAAWRGVFAPNTLGDSLASFRRLLAATKETPELREAAREIAHSRPALFLLYLDSVDPSAVVGEIEAWRARDPELSAFTRSQLRAIFQHWWPHEPARLAEMIRSDEQWLWAGWPLLALEFAGRQRFEEACALVREHVSRPWSAYLLSESREALRLRLLRNPADVAAALTLSIVEERAGDLPMARFVIAKAVEQKGAPTDLYWRQAELATRAGDHEAAWNALRRYAKF